MLKKILIPSVLISLSLLAGCISQKPKTPARAGVGLLNEPMDISIVSVTPWTNGYNKIILDALNVNVGSNYTLLISPKVQGPYYFYWPFTATNTTHRIVRGTTNAIAIRFYRLAEGNVTYTLYSHDWDNSVLPEEEFKVYPGCTNYVALTNKYPPIPEFRSTKTRFKK